VWRAVSYKEVCDFTPGGGNSKLISNVKMVADSLKNRKEALGLVQTDPVPALPILKQHR
jgi:hypothetical protein